MPRIKACLAYKQAYDEQNTKEFQFQNFSLTTSSAMVLEGLRQALRVVSTCLELQVLSPCAVICLL